MEMVKAAPSIQQGLNQLLKLRLNFAWFPTELGTSEILIYFWTGPTAMAGNHSPQHFMKHVAETMRTRPGTSHCVPTHQLPALQLEKVASWKLHRQWDINRNK